MELFPILLIDDDLEMNSRLRRLLEGHQIEAPSARVVPSVDVVNVELVQDEPLKWRIADSTLDALERFSERQYRLIMVDFALADEAAKDVLWGRDRKKKATRQDAKNRILTIRDLAEQYHARLESRGTAQYQSVFNKARRVLLRSMVPNLEFDILGPVTPNRLNETRAVFPKASVFALDPRNEFYAGDMYYRFYESAGGRDFYRQLVGGHYLRIVEAEVLRSRLEAIERDPHLGSSSNDGITVFLSYSHDDAERAARLHSRLQASGFSVYMAEHALVGGDAFSDHIRTALLRSREVWVLVTPSSLKSEWVLTEWGAAWALGRRIVPILHRCGPDSLPGRLRSLQCVDFDDLDSALEQLKCRTLMV